MIAAKKGELVSMLDRADQHVRQLSGDISKVVSTRDLVQQQAIELQKVVRSKCNELRQAVDIREGILSSQLDQMRQQKDAELVEKGHNLKDVVVRTQHLCSSLTQLLNEEDADPNAFMANVLKILGEFLSRFLMSFFANKFAAKTVWLRSNTKLGLL